MNILIITYALFSWVLWYSSIVCDKTFPISWKSWTLKCRNSFLKQNVDFESTTLWLLFHIEVVIEMQQCKKNWSKIRLWCCYFVINDLRWDVIVCFDDIGEIFDHHCLNFLFIIHEGKQLCPTHELSI